MSHRERRQRGEGALKVVISLVVLIMVVIALSKVMPVHVRANEFWDTMQEQANYGGMRSIEKIHEAIWRKAQELNIPLQKNDIKVSQRASTLYVNAVYSQTVDVFGYKYTYNFDKTSEKPIF